MWKFVFGDVTAVVTLSFTAIPMSEQSLFVFLSLHSALLIRVQRNSMSEKWVKS